MSLVEVAISEKQVEKLLASMQLAKYPKLDHNVATVTLAQPAMATTAPTTAE